jgi:hypothetical protein
MKVTMPLGHAAGVADGNLDILRGGWSITGPPTRHGQTCADLEARLAQAPDPWEGTAAKRRGGG